MPNIEYGSSRVQDFLEASALRHVADGLPLPEIRSAGRAISDWDGWVGYWVGRCRALSDMGRSASTAASRAELLVTASLCAHLAQYLHFHDPVCKASALREKVAAYRLAMGSMAHRAETVVVPFGSALLPAVLHVPHSHDPPPCVLYVGGLDAHKEDAHQFVALCLARGMAVLAVDGPGQGEAMLSGLRFQPGAHEAVGAVIDHLETRPDVDARRVGVIGRSLGGFLAPRAAADEGRLKALVVWSAMYDLSALASFPADTKAGFRHITGASSFEETLERVAWVDLSGHASRIDIPTLIVHGDDDQLTPGWHAERLADDIGPTCELRVIAGSGHCNHDQAHLVRPVMADWLAQHLCLTE